MNFDDILHGVNEGIAAVVAVLWTEATFVVLLGMGVVFTLWSKFIQIRSLTHGVQLIRGKYDNLRDPGAISHFQALSTALSGTVGLGNIGGVALAISAGGPGALFWMWMTGFLGMAIKAVEVTLAMMYRDTSDPDNPRGGAMWVITRGWGDVRGGWARIVARVVGGIFAAVLLMATFTSGNMFQSWNVADITNKYFGVPQVATGIVLATVAGLVIIGGIKRIGDVTAWLTPTMCGLYLLSGAVVLFVEAANVPKLLLLVVEEAFSPTKAQGAFLGATMWFGLTTGLRRALFSNEAGQGSSPVAHSAARTTEPAREGIVAGLEPFIDTCLVCTLTALVILCTGTWNRGPVGEFKGFIDLVPDSSNGAWRVQASTDLGSLPLLHHHEEWAADHRFFLLAQQAEPIKGTGERLVKVEGQLEIDPNDPDERLQITWWPAPNEARGMATLVDMRVYRDFKAAALTGHAFDRAVPGLGKWLVTFTCWMFAVSTMISWSYYGEQATVYLFGTWAVTLYKLLFCVAAIVASLPQFLRTDEQLGNLCDLGAGCMLIANAPIILFMSGRAIGVLADYGRRLRHGDFSETT